MSQSPLLDEFVKLMGDAGATYGQFKKEDLATLTSKDALLVIDMQNDFLPGGSFGVAEGDQTQQGICQLIDSFVAAGASVVATRDYHPVDHCSFNTHGGPFPPHCVQAAAGSFFAPAIGTALQKYVPEQKAHVVFKGFSNGIDSFGGFPYTDDAAKGRLTANPGCSHCEVSWTGSFKLFSSNMAKDVNAPPDVMAVLDRKPLADLLPHKEDGRLFVVGLALDFCVLDTAVNAARGGYKSVHILLDCCRAAHIPGFGTFGSGFLSDPAKVVSQCKDFNIALVRTTL